MTHKVEDSRSFSFTNISGIHTEASPSKYEPFRPILDRVLIRRVEEEEKAGLGVPSKYRQQTNRGVVVAIGDFFVMGGERIDMAFYLKIGDHVLFGEYNAEKFIKDDEELWLVRIQDIRGVERLIPQVKHLDAPPHHTTYPSLDYVGGFAYNDKGQAVAQWSPVPYFGGSDAQK